MANQNMKKEEAADTKLTAGVTQYFGPGNVTLTVAGVVMTPAAVEAAIQSRVTSANAVTTAKAAFIKAAADRKALLASTQSVVSAVRQIALIMYANQPDVLTFFGLAPRKAPVPLTLAEKAERAAKGAATRLARGTMGPKAKAKVKGVVPTATAASTTSGASAGAATNPVATPVTVSTPVTGGAGSGHA